MIYSAICYNGLEGRHSKYSVDECAIKYIVGHTINDVAERVYTTLDFSWMKAEICKIK